MKKLTALLLCLPVGFGLADTAQSVAGTSNDTPPPPDVGELMNAMGCSVFRVRMPAKIPRLATACLMHRQPGGRIQKLGSVSLMEPNQIVTLFYFRHGQSKPSYTLTTTGSSTMGELDIATPLASMNRNPKYYSSGEGLVTFTYTNDVDHDGKSLSTSSTLYVALLNQEGESDPGE